MRQHYEPLRNYTKEDEVFDLLLFISKEAEERWEQMEDSTKDYIMSHLRSACQRVEAKISIEILCNVINRMNDQMMKMHKRVEELERKLL
jgi:hypothetical protein